jgi:AraC-like DNA-binding protein
MIDLSQVPQGRNLHFLQLGKDPTQSLLGCGFIEKTSVKDHYNQVRFPHFGIVWLLRGQGTYTDSQGVTYLLRPGSAFFRIPGELHSQTVDPQSQWLEAFLAFGTPFYRGLESLGQMPSGPRVFEPGISQDLLDQWIITYNRFLEYQTYNPEIPAHLRKASIQSTNSFKQHINPTGTSELVMLTMYVFTQLVSGSANEIAKPLSQLHTLQAEIWRQPHRLTSHIQDLGSQHHEKPTSTLVQRAKALLGAPDLPSPEQVAKLLPLGYSTLRRRFAQETGESMAKFSLRLRMNKAKDLLTNSKKPIKEIARDLGYKSPSAFTQQFKHSAGLVPEEFRNQLYTSNNSEQIGP